MMFSGSVRCSSMISHHFIDGRLEIHACLRRDESAVFGLLRQCSRSILHCRNKTPAPRPPSVAETYSMPLSIRILTRIWKGAGTTCCADSVHSVCTLLSKIYVTIARIPRLRIIRLLRCHIKSVLPPYDRRISEDRQQLLLVRLDISR